MRIKKITDNNISYYYLEHSIRNGSKVNKKSIYLGKQIPKNIDEIKQKMFQDINEEKYRQIEIIKNNFRKELKSISKFDKEKAIEIFATRFTYDTQRIEGSNMTFRDTAFLLEKGITPNNKPISDVKEAEAHKKLFYKILEYEKDLTLNVILQWHKNLFQETKPEISGKIRKNRVGIAGSKYIPPLPVEIYPLLREFFKWYNKNKDNIHPIELAMLVHLKFVTIHPFSDGNGRISRIMMNFVLNKKGYPMFNIQYDSRKSYYSSLEHSNVKNNDSYFLNWFIKNYIKNNRMYLK